MVRAGGLYSFPNLKIKGQVYIATGSAYNSKSIVVDFFSSRCARKSHRLPFSLSETVYGSPF